FEYPAVDHKTGIRLLILQPGKRGSRIKCKLVSTTFGDNPTYDALSYAWGDATPNRAMGLNGSEILVTDTLWDALASLRDERAPKAVWVDFLCINQKDEDEKSRQVPLMAFIY
ncbi:HET-domain-containing protein, partial [Stipitochalara longipes BDJ]